jgi:elongation of very long chain fatty acids protein 4
MCGPTTEVRPAQDTMSANQQAAKVEEPKPPVGAVLPPPTMFARYACASIMVATFGVWGKYAFVDEETAPSVGAPLHGYQVPLALTSAYLVSLPILRVLSKQFLSENVDVKLLLKETMVIYNGGQVLLNAWMVYRMIDAVLFRGHPFIGDVYTVNTGATFAVWIHYMDKYLEFFDTFFMVLRGRMDQVRAFETKVFYPRWTKVALTHL